MPPRIRGVTGNSTRLIVATCAGMSTTELMKLLAQQWREADNDVKAEFKELAAAAKAAMGDAAPSAVAGKKRRREAVAAAAEGV